MTFLYILSAVIIAIIIFYIAGFVISFCTLFIGFSGCRKECAVEDFIYSLGSWLSVMFLLMCWVIGREEEKADKQYYTD